MSTVQAPIQHVPTKLTDSIKLVDEAHAKTNLLGMTQAQLCDYFKSIGEKPFRATQVMKWIYQHGVTDFEKMKFQLQFS